jgi:hypothetical protein
MMAQLQQRHKQHNRKTHAHATKQTTITTPKKNKNQNHPISTNNIKDQISPLSKFNVCRLLFFSNAAANAAAPASPTLFPDDGAASAATQATQSQNPRPCHKTNNNRNTQKQQKSKSSNLYKQYQKSKSSHERLTEVMVGSLRMMPSMASSTFLLISSLILAVFSRMPPLFSAPFCLT